MTHSEFFMSILAPPCLSTVGEFMGKGWAKNGEDREVVKCYHESNNDEHYEDTSRSHDFCCERIRWPAILNWRSVRDRGEAFQFSIPSVVISPTCGIS